MSQIAAYERALSEALRIKVEEDMLETLFAGDEKMKELYRAHGVGRAPMMENQPTHYVEPRGPGQPGDLVPLTRDQKDGGT